MRSNAIIDPNSKQIVSVSESTTGGGQLIKTVYTMNPTPTVIMATPTPRTSRVQGVASWNTSYKLPPSPQNAGPAKAVRDQNKTKKESPNVKDPVMVQEPNKQQPSSLAPTDIPVSMSESPKAVREEFLCKVQQSITAPETEAHKSKNGKQETKRNLGVKDGQREITTLLTSALADGESKAVTLDEKKTKCVVSMQWWCTDTCTRSEIPI